MDRLKSSIREFGQLRPITINQDFEIIDGAARYTALINLSIDQIWVRQIR